MGAIAGKLGAVYKTYTGVDTFKLVADFQSDESWLSASGTLSVDSTNTRLGTQSVKITEDDNTGNFLYSNLESITLNLTQFQSGAVSDTSDYIQLVCYISDATKVASVYVGFDSDATYDETNAYYKTVSSGLITGWNYFRIKKSAFSSAGSPDWSSVQSVRVGWTSENNAQNAYISFQALHLIDASYEVALVNNIAYITSQIALATDWAINANVEMDDATTLDSEWDSVLPTISNYTATVNKLWENEDILNSLKSSLIFSFFVAKSLGYKYEGMATVNSNTIEVDKKAAIREGVGLTGQGELLYINQVIVNS